jgi:Glycosyltransferase family 87
LAVFLTAASRVTKGASPYAYSGDRTFAYPPLPGFLLEPFNALGAGVAAIAWPAVLLCAIAVALWLLGVRDWRCYALTAVYPMTRSCIDLGTVGPLLLLGVAVAWRWREHALRSATGLGAAVAVKLYLWPLLVWPAVMRRFRAAAGAAVFGAAFVLIPWAAIGFAGFGRYPGLLNRLSHHEASSSYSVIALGVRAHLPETVAFAVSLVIAAVLLAAAVWLARRDSLALRDRDVSVLTLTLAAALAASPIVWMHYFLLLLVPLALTRPRLSWLWFVPFAYYPLGEAAWPAGDARKLGIALVATLVLLIGSLFETLRALNRRPVRSIAASPARWPIASPSGARDNVTRTGSR